MRWLFTTSLVLGGCSDLIPAQPDLDARPIDTATRDVPADATVDVPDIAVKACEQDEDCADLAACCLDVVCQEGVCMPAYVHRCCTIQGPCAVSTVHRTGVCEATCEAKGCVESLLLGDDGCDTTLWELARNELGMAELRVDDPVADRVTWHLSALRPFAGTPSLRAGDVLCPSYATGLDPASCAPNGDGGAVALVFDTPLTELPAEAPAQVELWLYADLPESDGLSTPLDGLEMQVVTPVAAPLTIWSSRMTPIPLRAWTPVLIDLSLWAGHPVQLRFRFDTLDGRDNDYEGVALGRVRLRTACAADRSASDRDACTIAFPTEVRGLRDRLVVFGPPDPDRACEPCSVAAGCTRGDTCDVATCADGRCHLERELTHACCTADARWPGDGSFEAPLALAPGDDGDGWSVSGSWAVSGLRSYAGESALHFGLSDGSGLALPGQAAAGEVTSPFIDVPEDAPRWRFSLWLATEWDFLAEAGGPIDNPAGVDLLEALVLPDAPLPLAPIVVWDSRAIGGTTLGAWRDVTIDLTAWRGQRVRLGWRFSTGDADANEAEGVYIDRAVVFRACPGCDDGAIVPGDPACEAVTP